MPIRGLRQESAPAPVPSEKGQMMISSAEGGLPQAVMVRPMIETDHVDADRIVRMAFGTFLGLPDPITFAGDADYIRTRWRAAPEAALTAEIDGQVVGSNFATRWGSVGFLGPLTVDPSVWDRGVARRLMHNIVDIMDSWGLTHSGLFTFSHSPKHLALYQLYGFQPRFLTSVLSAPAGSSRSSVGWSNYSVDPDRDRRLADCASLTDLGSAADLD
jgi:predicted N-acetyltransferase YhbS